MHNNYTTNAMQNLTKTQKHIVHPLPNCIVEIETTDGVRARKVISRSKARGTFKHPSWKVGRMVHCESPLERDVARLLDADPFVVRHNEQPLVVHFRMNGMTHRHYPDFLVERRGGRKVLVEVKPVDATSDEFVAKRTQLLTRLLPDWGYDYCVITGEWAARQPRMSNVETMLRYGRSPITLVQAEALRRALEVQSSVTWGELCDGKLGDSGRQIAARGVLEGRLMFALDQPLSAATRFSPGSLPSLVWGE